MDMTHPVPTDGDTSTAPALPADGNGAEGMVEGHYPSGVLRLATRMHEGKPDGPAEMWDEEGRPTFRGEFVNGVLHGEMLLYQEGRLAMRLEFFEGKKHGPSVSYDPSGEPTARITWVQDEMEGPATYYGPGEAVTRKESYRAGVLHGTVVDYYPSGAIQQQSEWRDGVLEGEQVTFDPSGAVISRIHYRAGEPMPPGSGGGGRAVRRVVGPTLLDRLLARLRR